MKIVHKGIALLLAISFLLTNIAGEIQAKGKGRLLNENDISNGIMRDISTVMGNKRQVL